MTTSGQPFKVDRAARKARQKTRPARARQREYVQHQPDTGETMTLVREYAPTPEEVEARALVTTLARSFVAMIEFYKSPYGGEKPHDLAVAEAEAFHKHTLEWARSKPEGIDADKISWHQIAAIGQENLQKSLDVWARVCEVADDELASGRRAAKWPDLSPALTRSRSSLRSARRSLTSGNHAAASNPP